MYLIVYIPKASLFTLINKFLEWHTWSQYMWLLLCIKLSLFVNKILSPIMKCWIFSIQITLYRVEFTFWVLFVIKITNAELFIQVHIWSLFLCRLALYQTLIVFSSRKLKALVRYQISNQLWQNAPFSSILLLFMARLRRLELEVVWYCSMFKALDLNFTYNLYSDTMAATLTIISQF